MKKDYKDKVFIALYCIKAKPYINYECKKVDKQENVPMVLLIDRWDGKKGFPGGTIDVDNPTEDDVELYLRKELIEEINYTLKKYPKKLKITKSERGSSHFYSLEVTYDELLEIQKNWMFARDAHSEITGISISHLRKYSYENLLNHNYSGSAKEELIYLVENKLKEYV